MAYTDDRYGTLQALTYADVDSNATAASVQVAHYFASKSKVTEVRGYIKAAGTGTTAGYTIKKGTASIGVLTLGTNTAGQFIAASLTDTTFSSGDELSLCNVTSDTQMTADLQVDYQEAF